jgi:hypothetical protein
VGGYGGFNLPRLRRRADEGACSFPTPQHTRTQPSSLTLPSPLPPPHFPPLCGVLSTWSACSCHTSTTHASTEHASPLYPTLPSDPAPHTLPIQAVPRYVVHFERVHLPPVDHTALLHAAFSFGAAHPNDGSGSPLSERSAPAAAVLRLAAAAHLAAGHLAAAAANGAPPPIGCGASGSPPPRVDSASSFSLSSSFASLPHPVHAVSLPSSSYAPSLASSCNDLNALMAASSPFSHQHSGGGGSYAHPSGIATFDDGRYEQRLTPSSPWPLGDERCTRTRAYDRRTRRDVFLKLACNPLEAGREAEALRKVGPSHAPELYDQFSLSPAEGGGLAGEVLVLEAAQPGPDVSIHQLCRRAVHALSEEGPDPLAAGDTASLMVTAYAQRVIQLVGRVHEVRVRPGLFGREASVPPCPENCACHCSLALLVDVGICWHPRSGSLRLPSSPCRLD